MPRDRVLVEHWRQLGVLPWFATPGVQIEFFRPLSSALIALDHGLFGRAPLPYHLHTLAWYAALLATVAALLRRLLPLPFAVLVSLIFCVDDAHVMTVGWSAARNAVVACVPVFLALWAHVRFRVEGWRPGAVLAPVGVVVGLAGGEMAVGALAYFVAWEAIEGRSKRARALLPYAVVVAAYVAVYVATGAGARDSAGYYDPLGSPLAFARVLPGRVLLLAGGLFFGMPLDFLLLDERLRGPMLLAGAAALALVGSWLPFALRRMAADEARAVRWLGLGAAGALLVGTPGLLGDRVLLAAGVGGAVVVAALLRDGWRLLRRPRSRRPTAALGALGVVAFGVPNLVVAPLALPAKILLLGRIAADDLRLAREAEIEAPVPARVVTLAMDNLLPLNLAVLRAFAIGPDVATLRLWSEATPPRPVALPDRFGAYGTTNLSLASTEHRLRRTASDTFELFTPAGTLLDGVWSEIFRPSWRPLLRGSRVQLPFLSVDVVDDDGERPTRVSFRFDRPVDDPALIFLVRTGGKLRRFSMPPVGQEVDVPQQRMGQE